MSATGEMSATKPIPVRLGDEVIERLDRAAKSVGNNRAAVIRMLGTKWLEAFEANPSEVMPPDWKSLVEAYDGRKNQSAREREIAAREKGPNE